MLAEKEILDELFNKTENIYDELDQLQNLIQTRLLELAPGNKDSIGEVITEI